MTHDHEQMRHSVNNIFDLDD